MRSTTKVLATVGVAAVALAAFAGTALAEPTSTPPDSSIVAAGSDTIQKLGDQYQTDFSGFYSYDAVAPSGTTPSTITPKVGCASITRPNGSGAGISALAANAQPSGDSTDYCIDIARSSRGPNLPGGTSTPDPKGLAFVPIAGDGVTWSAESSTNAPATLTPAQLGAIYNCNAAPLGTKKKPLSGPVTWNEVGGTGTDAVVPVLPQSASGTRAFFLAQIGVTTPGSCVTTSNTSTTNTVEENEGTDPIFGNNSNYDTQDIVFPYSIAVYIAQSEHNATGVGTGDSKQEGPLVLQRVNNQVPTKGAGAKEVINSKTFPFLRDVYFVVRDSGTAAIVPTYLQKFLGSDDNSGFICGKTAVKDFESLGFYSLNKNCGKITQTT